jgi:hypothetical protein
MTQQVRKSYRNHRKATWAGMLVVVVVASLAVVLPALGSDTDPCVYPDCVPPESTLQTIGPSIVNVGGSNFSCASAGENYGGTPTPAGMRQFQISKPTPGSYTDPATGVTIDVRGPTGSQSPTSFFSFSVRGNAAVVYHVAVKGGTNVAWYDYYNNRPDHPALTLSGRGVFSDDDLHSTPDSKYAPNPPSKQTFFVASITTFCYVPLNTATPSCDTPFNGIDFNGTGGTAEYFAQLVGVNGGCKTGNVVMYSYTEGTNKLFAALYPVTPGGPLYEVVEHIHWTGITGNSQNMITLRYDDIAPYDGVDTAGIPGNDGWRVMKFCDDDPRPDPTAAPFDLGGNTPGMPAGETTCILQSTDSAGTLLSGLSKDAWLFSFVDGARGGI